MRQRLCATLFAALLACTAEPINAQELIANMGLADGDLARNQARLLFTLRMQRWSDNQSVRSSSRRATDLRRRTYRYRLLDPIGPMQHRNMDLDRGVCL